MIGEEAKTNKADAGVRTTIGASVERRGAESQSPARRDLDDIEKVATGNEELSSRAEVQTSIAWSRRGCSPTCRNSADVDGKTGFEPDRRPRRASPAGGRGKASSAARAPSRAGRSTWPPSPRSGTTNDMAAKYAELRARPKPRTWP